jgi:predicted lipoprotein with Yx(FWY)xxD motif
MKYATLFAALLQTALVVHANPTIETNGVLTSREGRTLYTFDKDSAGTSACKGGCIAAWPAFTVANAALAGGDFSIVVRDDGVQQWAFQGKPLYFFAGDARPGDVNGDKQGGVWHVVRKSVPAKSARAYDAPSSFSAGYSY